MNNHPFFTRNLAIQNHSRSNSSKQFVLPHIHFDNPDSLNSSSMMAFGNNPMNTSYSSTGKEYRKFGHSQNKKSSNKINSEDLQVSQHRVQLQNEKIDKKALQKEKNKIFGKVDSLNVQKQISERAHTSKQQIGQSRIKNQNSIQKQKQRPSLSKSKLKRLNFIKKKSFQTDKNCLSQKLSHQLNHELPEEIATKKINRKLSINTMTDVFLGELNPKNPIQELQLKKITEHSIEVTPSNKVNKQIICVTCGNFLINIQKIYEKSIRENKKIKELFIYLKQENIKLKQEVIKFKSLLIGQVQSFGLQFVNTIKKTFRDENKQNFNKIKTQQNTSSIKIREFQKLNRSAIYSSTDQQSISSFASRERLDTKIQERKWQKSQSSSNSIGKIMKNYGSRKENQKKHNRKLQLQIIINKYEGKFKKNGNQVLNYGKIVPNCHKKTESVIKQYSSPLTERLIKYQSEFEQQKAMSKSFIERQESYRQCYNNIREVLDKMKSIF